MIADIGINDILNQLRDRGIIDYCTKAVPLLTGTTDGKVYMICEHNEPKYILKQDRPDHISLVTQFHQTYVHCSLLQQVRYVDPDNTYVLFSYIEGTTHVNRGPKRDWMECLTENLLNHYEIVHETQRWGRMGLLRNSWHEFNERSLEGARRNVDGILPAEDSDKMKSIIEDISNVNYSYALHGDTGVHNFVFNEGGLAGVIDPSPMVGPILYDFTYAFCSSPDDLNLDTLWAAFERLKLHEPMDQTRLIKEVVFQLYTRIGICVKAHPHDLQDYLQAWDYWKKLLS